MKVETPQLRWHQEMNPTSKKDQGANGPIRSCSLLTINENMGVLATAGNTEVNLWRVGFTADGARFSSSSSSSSSGTTSSATTQDGACDNNNNMEGASQQPSSHILVQPQTKTTATTTTQHKMTEHTQIEHIVTLSRGTNERSINAVKFSPSGQHLVGAGDNGTVVVWTIPPPSTTSTSNNLLNWSRIEKDADLPMRIIPNHTDDVMDVAWSSDSKRFTVCSLDHTLNVWELVAAGDWKKVHGSDKDHTHYIQGVAYDPKGVYLASMGSDRMVKVYTRKVVKESVIKGELAKYDIDTSITEEGNGSSNTTTDEEAKQGKGEQVDKKKKQQHAIVQSKILPEVLAESSFKLQTKGVKTLKFLSAPTSTKAASATTTKSSSPSNAESNDKDGAKENTGNTKRHHMFADELTLGSFFRRLSFTTDGAFLVVPAAMWHGRSSSTDTTAPKEGGPTSPTSVGAMNKLNESSFATYLFARHHFDQPYKVLTGLDKVSVMCQVVPYVLDIPESSFTHK